MLRLCVTLLAVVALVNSSPVEKKRPIVVDVPAVIFDEGSDAPNVEKSEKESSPVVETVDPGSVEVIEPKKPTNFDSSVSLEDAEVPDRTTDFFGFRLPPLFVYRRPLIRDPFTAPRDPFLSSFPSFSTFSRPQQPVESPPSSFNMMSHMEKMMQRMQQQMSSLWGALLNPSPSVNRPFRPSFLDSDESKDNETSIYGNIPANYKNSTSETKVIDGQLVTVNKTVHRISSNNSSGFFQVQVINIRPQGPFKAKTTTEKPVVISEATKNEEKIVPADDIEQTTSPTAEDPSLNELDALNDVMEGDKEKADEGKISIKGGLPYGYETSDEIEAESNPNTEIEFVPLEDIEKMNSKQRKTRMPYDLSSDLRVNKLAEARLLNSGNLRMLDDDVEIIDA